MKRILVGIDGTESSAEVLGAAIELARIWSAKLRLVRSVVVAPELLPFGAFVPPVGPGGLLAAPRASLRALEARVPEAMRDGVDVRMGGAARSICDAAREYGADLVVIGAHRHGALGRALGTTAAGVANHLDRPLFVVRSAPRADAASAKEREGEREPVLPPKEHTLLESTTLAGAVAGAVVGSIAGPPGAVAGEVIGTAIGFVAGAALDDQDARASFHDRELDDAIGVTRGDLGARDRAAKALSELEAGASTNASFEAASAVLRADHARLEGIYEELLDAYRLGEWNDVRKAWDVFAPALLAHLANEETNVFPAFEEANPVEAKALRDQHDALRKQLGAFGVCVDLHAFPSDDAEALVAALRAHAARESRLLYPWLDAALGVAPAPAPVAAPGRTAA